MAEVEDYEQSFKCMEDKYKARIRNLEKMIDQLQSPDSSSINVKRPKSSSIARDTDVKCEGTTFSSKVRDRDFAEALTLPPNKSKVVRIDPKPPTVEEFRKECSSISPMIPSNIAVQKYEWTSYFFLKPTKSALKKRTSQLPMDSSVLSHAPISPVPSRMLPPTSPAEKPVNSNTLPLMPSSAVPSTQPNIKDVLATSATSKIPLSSSSLSPYRDSTSTRLPASPRDPTGLPPILPKSRSTMVPPISPPNGSPNTNTSSLKSPSDARKLSLKDSTTLPVISEKKAVGTKLLCDHGKSSSVKLKKTSTCELLTEQKKFPPIKTPPRSSQNRLKKSSTCSTVSERLLPPIPLECSNKDLKKQKSCSAMSQSKGCSGSVKSKNSSKILLIPFSAMPQKCSKVAPSRKDSDITLANSSSKVLAMSSKDHSKLPLKTPNRILLAPPIRPPVSPEKPRKETTRKVPSKPLNIAKENPEKLQEYIRVQIDEAHNAIPVVYHKCYNLRLLPYSMDRFQLMIPDKPAKVYAMLQSECLKEYRCVKWTGADVSTVYNIVDYVPDFTMITEFDIKWIARLMKLYMVTSVTSPDKFNAAILQPLRVQIMGSVLACELALDKGWAINIGGGFSHYSVNNPIGGLHIYDDVLICLAIISKSPKVDKILVISVDAYQCLSYTFENVTSSTISCPVDIIDIYSQKTFWHDYVDLPHCFTTEVDYDILLHELPANGHQLTEKGSSHFDQCISKFQTEMDGLYKDTPCLLPSLCVYVAGSYSLKEHTHAVMSLSQEEIVKRDQAVFELIYKVYKIPIVILLGGGYHPWDVDVAAASVSNLCQIGIPLLGQR